MCGATIVSLRKLDENPDKEEPSFCSEASWIMIRSDFCRTHESLSILFHTGGDSATRSGPLITFLLSSEPPCIEWPDVQPHLYYKGFEVVCCVQWIKQRHYKLLPVSTLPKLFLILLWSVTARSRAVLHHPLLLFELQDLKGKRCHRNVRLQLEATPLNLTFSYHITDLAAYDNKLCLLGIHWFSLHHFLPFNPFNFSAAVVLRV